MTDHMSEILIGAKALHRELERKIADQQAKIAYLKKNNRDWARKTWIALALGFLVTGILIYNELTVHPMPEFMKPFEKMHTQHEPNRASNG